MDRYLGRNKKSFFQIEQKKDIVAKKYRKITKSVRNDTGKAFSYFLILFLFKDTIQEGLFLLEKTVENQEI